MGMGVDVDVNVEWGGVGALVWARATVGAKRARNIWRKF